MARMKTRKRTEAEKMAMVQDKLMEEDKGGYVNHNGEIVYPTRDPSMPENWSFNPDHPMHKPKRQPPPHSRVESTPTGLYNAYTGGREFNAPYHGKYPTPSGETFLLDDRFWVGYHAKRFATPDDASDALWTEYARKMDNGEAYAHEDYWHTLPGASPEEVLGEQG